MSKATLNRVGLADALVSKVGLPRQECEQVVELIVEEIASTLSRGEDVKLSCFGSFRVRRTPQRPGRNPKTLAPVTIPARKVVVFRPSNVLKGRLSSKRRQLDARRYGAGCSKS
jgi:integration host factor subunit alpha